MNQSNEQLFEWRRLRRKVTFWRAVSFIILGLIIVSLVGSLAMDGLNKNHEHIAKIRVEGLITEDEELIGRIKEAGENDAVKAIILSIDSSGGTTVGGEAIFEAVRAAAAKKPVATEIGTLAASAGYMIAVATDHIVARQSSIIGSIGVIVQLPNFTGLLDKLGVDVDAIKSSPLKAEPSMFNATTDDERAMIQNMIDDSYDWFVSLVTDRRPLSRAEVEKLATGAVFTGRQALDLKLIDATGGEDIVLAWFKKQNVDIELEVLEWSAPERGSNFVRFQSLMGLEGQSQDWLHLIGEETGLKRLFMQGMLSLWRGDSS